MTKQQPPTFPDYHHPKEHMAEGQEDVILILEDESHPARQIRVHLERAGYNVIWSSDLQEALENVNNRIIAAVIADVHIRDKGAVDFIRITRRQQPGTYLIGISGLFGTEYVEKMKLICDDFLSKPINYDYLRKLLDQALLNRKQRMHEWLQGVSNPSGEAQPKQNTSVGQESLLTDPNLRAYEEMKGDLRQHHLGEYVAFLNGELVGLDTDRENLISRVYQEHGETNILIQRIQEDDEVVRLRRPRKTLSED